MFVSKETTTWQNHDARHTPEFRAGAVQIVRKTHKPIAQVAPELGIGTGILDTWGRKDKI